MRVKYLPDAPKSAFLLGNGTRNLVKVTFYPFDCEGFFDSSFGTLSYQYWTPGGWMANRKAVQEIKKLIQLGLHVYIVEIISNYPIERILKCRKRHEVYKKIKKKWNLL